MVYVECAAKEIAHEWQNIAVAGARPERRGRVRVRRQRARASRDEYIGSATRDDRRQARGIFVGTAGAFHRAG
jgi:hypothetical protein